MAKNRDSAHDLEHCRGDSVHGIGYRSRMAQTEHGWQIVDEAAGVLAREYTFNSSGGTATTFVARMPGRKLLVLSPGVGFGDAAIDDLAAYGEVAAVVATNGFHHLGMADWRERFPRARFFAPDAAMARISKKNPAAGEFESIEALSPLLGETIGLRSAEGTKCGETWAWVRTEDGYIWFASDVLCNMDEFPGPWLFRLLWRWSNSGPGFKIFHLAMMPIVKDKPLVLRTMLDDMRAHPPTVIVPAHGAVLQRQGIAEEAAALLSAALV